MYEEPEPVAMDSVMRTPVHTVGLSDPVRKAVSMMYELEVGSVVVAEDLKPVGIFTERDLVKVMSHDPKGLDEPIVNAMSKPVVTLDLKEAPTTGLVRMARNKITHLPIVDGGKLVGIVTHKDLVAWFIKHPGLLMGL